MSPPHIASDLEFRLPRGEEVPEAVYPLSRLPHTPAVDWSAFWQIGQLHQRATGKGVVVGIADTGIDLDHPAYAGQVLAARDFTGSRSGSSDVNGHGTHCAGIVAALRDSSTGVGAAPDSKLLIAKVLGDNGSGGGQGIAAGIRWLADQGADVISLSLGSQAADRLIIDAIEYALSQRAVVVAAAGNDGPGPETVDWPGRYPGTICVGAADRSGQIANFSSRGPAVDCAGNGVQVVSSLPGGRAGRLSGTSMATPHVAGGIACLIEWLTRTNADWKPDDITRIVRDTSQPPAPQFDRAAYGSGNFLPSLWLDRQPAPAPVPTPTPAPDPDRDVLRLAVVIRNLRGPGPWTASAEADAHQ